MTLSLEAFPYAPDDFEQILEYFVSPQRFEARVVAIADPRSPVNAGELSSMRSVRVAGNGTDLVNGAIVHAKRQTPNGFVQMSTEIVELKGDLIAKILYHVTSTVDLMIGTLVNTGDQIFSGTIANSDPVMIHDAPAPPSSV